MNSTSNAAFLSPAPAILPITARACDRIPSNCDKYTEFSTSFGFGGHLYEITVDTRGQLVSLDEWYGMGDFEDGNDPDNHYTKKSKGIKWELFEQ